MRIGLLTAQGGSAYLKQIRKLCQASLPWVTNHWEKEIQAYLDQWNDSHALPIKRTESRDRQVPINKLHQSAGNCVKQAL